MGQSLHGSSESLLTNVGTVSPDRSAALGHQQECNAADSHATPIESREKEGQVVFFLLLEKIAKHFQTIQACCVTETYDRSETNDRVRGSNTKLTGNL
jgi:hypothetical protein